MLSTSVLKRHAGLVDNMARAVGVDLEEATMRGAVEFDEIADAVLRCTGCAHPGACEDWLEGRGAVAEAGTPDYCRNARMFDRIKAQTGA